MDVAVVYESLYGNTREVAEAIAAGMTEAEPAAQVAVLPVAQAKPEAVANADLLVVGGPTHIMRMSSRRSREQGVRAMERQQAQVERPAHHLEPGATGPGVRDWLAELPRTGPDHRAAAFDTRLKYPLAGGAARPIARELRHHGYRLAAKPAGFVVSDAEGPLRPGEHDRAKSWGAELVRSLARPASG